MREWRSADDENSRAFARGVLLAFLIVLGLIVLVLATGCRSWSPVAATSEQETFIVAETARISALAGQRVTGEISSTLYQVACSNGDPNCHAAGWYVGGYGRGSQGTAYFYQKDVNRYDEPTLTGLVAHEVAHSITGPEHDAKHAACTAALTAGKPC